MNESTTEEVTRLLCFMLRHNPTKFGVEISSEGWANADLVAPVVSRRCKVRSWLPWTASDLERFAAEHSNRFEFAGGCIRARYGHSLPVVVGETASPPDFLYHGTDLSNLTDIRLLGLKPKTRHYVHLTSDTSYAAEVADTKEGDATILLVHSMSAWVSGVLFRQATEHVWLTEELPAQFLEPHTYISRSSGMTSLRRVQL